jgi:hypothetical protein
MKFKPVYSKRSYRQALGRIQRYHSNPYLDWARQITLSKYFSWAPERYPIRFNYTEGIGYSLDPSCNPLADQNTVTKELNTIINKLK